MLVRLVLLLCVALCHLGSAQALPGLGWFAQVAVDNAATVGIPLPGYMNLLSSKSTLLTRLLHLIFGNKLEERFKLVIEKERDLIDDSATMTDVNDDNEEKLTFRNGKMTGLKTIQVTPNTDVQVIWSHTGLPVAVVSVKFTGLKINANIQTTFFKGVPFAEHKVDGNADVKFLDNNFTLKFHLFPGIFEWCYLRLYDVVVTDLEEMIWTVKKHDGTEDVKGGSLMQGYFSTTDGTVEDHIKTAIINEIYYKVPEASAAICDNKDRILKLSQYDTVRQTKKETVEIMDKLKKDADAYKKQQQETK